MGDHRYVFTNGFADRLGELFALTPGERDALNALGERERVLKRGANLIREHDHTGELYILKRGMMMSYVVLDDGSRQILRFLFPGDLLGGAALAYAKSPETIAALTEAAVCAFERAALARVIERHPRLAGAIVALGQMEQVALTDRLAGVGRTAARGRIAAVLLEISDRTHATRDGGDGFVLGITQEEIGDATGLTAVHVNRMLRQMEEEGLIARAAGRVSFRDERALRRMANHVDRMAGLDLGWLPPGR